MPVRARVGGYALFPAPEPRVHWVPKHHSPEASDLCL